MASEEQKLYQAANSKEHSSQEQEMKDLQEAKVKVGHSSHSFLPLEKGSKNDRAPFGAGSGCVVKANKNQTKCVICL